MIPRPAAPAICLTLLVLAGALDPLRAAPMESDLSVTAGRELKELTDPTILQSRTWLDSEWNELDHGAGDGKFTLGGLYAWPISARQDWAVRLKLPVGWHDAGDLPGDSDEAGLGDIELATGTAFRLCETWRTAGGLELHGDTASDDALGDEVWRLKPFWSVAYDPANWITLTFTAEYNHSVEEQTGVAPQRYCELMAPMTILLSDQWSFSTQLKAKCDFEDGNRWTHTIQAGTSWRLTTMPLAFGLSLEKPLGGGEKEFQTNFGTTYFFDH